MGIFGEEIGNYLMYRSSWISVKLYRVMEVFTITLILPRSVVLDGISAGVLAITAAGIDNIASGKGGKGSVQYV